ncbi:hypothetical protein CLU79DRAFT_773195 [Phycomyces nitens]|nr:hypothetical protein CLU79DRAFT_773195 [Phycomyces nitens]
MQKSHQDSYSLSTLMNQPKELVHPTVHPTVHPIVSPKARLQTTKQSPPRTPLRHIILPDSHVSVFSPSASFTNKSPPNDSPVNKPAWTIKEWQELERCYVTSDRDIERASRSFYRHYSLLPNETSGETRQEKELWSLKDVQWRCRCLDTNSRFRYGKLPSERARIPDKKRKREGDSVESPKIEPQTKSENVGKRPKLSATRQSSSLMEWISETLFS